jgi:hypothetical protein
MSRMYKGRRRALTGFLFLDIVIDPATRPIFLYAASLIVAGATIYHFLEGWGWVDSFYFVVITVATIGYGDFVPTTPISKILTIFFGLNGVILLLMLFDAVRTARGWYISGSSTGTETDESNQQ